MGGLGITQALRTAYGPHSLLLGIAKAYEEALEAIPKRGDLPKVVATLGARNSHYRHEHLCLARHLSTWRMIVAPLFLLEEGPSGVRLGDTGIGVIHRLFRAPGALKTEPGKRVLRAVLQGRVILINPWKDFLEDKRLLALVHEDRAEELLEDHLTEGEWKSLQEMIPPTWKATRERLAQVMGLSGSSRRSLSWEKAQFPTVGGSLQEGQRRGGLDPPERSEIYSDPLDLLGSFLRGHQEDDGLY